jgi:16S rRNA (adenine1518-N6/adenine1519-N6)-dimethyltransferase
VNRARRSAAPEAARRGHRPRKRFGQHFLEPAWAGKVAAAVAPQPGDRLIEIGPGRGALTLPLSAAGVPLRAIDVDRDLAAALVPLVPPHVEIVCADFLALPADQVFGDAVDGRVRVVGNLPYNLSSPILFRLLALARETGRIADAVLMLQREVADRVLASPGGGEYGPLAVLLGLYASRSRVLSLPPGAFRPPPEVHSAVIRLDFGAVAPPPVDYALLERLVRTAFQQRRKTLANALRALATGAGVALAEVLRSAGLDASLRPEAIPPAGYVALTAAWDRAEGAAVL